MFYEFSAPQTKSSNLVHLTDKVSNFIKARMFSFFSCKLPFAVFDEENKKFKFQPLKYDKWPRLNHCIVRLDTSISNVDKWDNISETFSSWTCFKFVLSVWHKMCFATKPTKLNKLTTFSNLFYCQRLTNFV